MAGFSLSREPMMSAAMLFFAGSLLVMCFSLTTSLAQLLAPPELRGRVVSIYMVAFRGGSPLGGLLSGWLVHAGRLGAQGADGQRHHAGGRRAVLPDPRPRPERRLRRTGHGGTEARRPSFKMQTSR